MDTIEKGVKLIPLRDDFDIVLESSFSFMEKFSLCPAQQNKKVP